MGVVPVGFQAFSDSGARKFVYESRGSRLRLGLRSLILSKAGGCLFKLLRIARQEPSKGPLS